jgi:hypothetical protein
MGMGRARSKRGAVISSMDFQPDAHWIEVKNPKAPAVKREAEEDWGR